MPPKQWGWSEKDMQETIAEYRAGKYTHAASAAVAYGIPARTLHWHLKNGDDMSQSKGHVHQQLLTPAQEKALLDWIIHLGLLAQPLDCWTIGPFVKDICGSFPGKNWLQ
ncbi:hypothetical protein BS47DRAFT_1369855 [Hydnum rufescens UP504]|uniref:HTH psq-type domain-containing protein n=1 Tax=Hydnum rufescens UP504 TaxID=1448309 RepID=A0A9P6ADL6_9AGAM|nr:hypothetical protein BS47DRAFT_1369855 [Hydnum rufescens UP504]